MVPMIAKVGLGLLGATLLYAFVAGEKPAHAAENPRTPDEPIPPPTNEVDHIKVAATKATQDVLKSEPPSTAADIPVAVPPAAPPVATSRVRPPEAVRLSQHLNQLILARGGVARAKGREDVSIVKAFQVFAGLTGSKVDGNYGPGTGLLLGRYVGDVPIIFYWPRNSIPSKAVPTYRSNLYTLALEAEQVGDTERSTQLNMSAAREKGQGYGTSTVVPVTKSDPAAVQQASTAQNLPNYLSSAQLSAADADNPYA